MIQILTQSGIFLVNMVNSVWNLKCLEKKTDLIVALVQRQSLILIKEQQDSD
ncbi:MAG: hypothetical protein J6J09_10495 [Phocaeicola sp.]|nr:hypothetical protein [Phocaeicola sp.]